MAIKVAVSPFYGAEAWTDELSGITFERSELEVMSVYDITNVPANKLDGIRKAVRLNALILVEGSLDEVKPAEEAPAVKEPIKKEAPEQEKKPAKEESAKEEKAEPEKTKQVKKTPKKK